MTGENMIAIVAIVVSGIISLSTLIASFYTNRANNKAKLVEIAYQKRLEAFSKIVETITEIEEIRSSVIGFRMTVQNFMDEQGCDSEDEVEDDLMSMLCHTAEKFIFRLVDLRSDWSKYSIYLPSDISEEVLKYINTYRRAGLVARHNVIKITDDIISKPPNSKIIPAMQKFIGLQ
jgi:hypothetical protein